MTPKGVKATQIKPSTASLQSNKAADPCIHSLLDTRRIPRLGPDVPVSLCPGTSPTADCCHSPSFRPAGGLSPVTVAFPRGVVCPLPSLAGPAGTPPMGLRRRRSPASLSGGGEGREVTDGRRPRGWGTGGKTTGERHNRRDMRKQSSTTQSC